MSIKRRSTIWLIAAMMMALLLAGCQETPLEATVPQTEPTVLPTETQAPETLPPTEPTEPTEPSPTSPPDGDPDDITCKGSYTGEVRALAQNAETVVATSGDAQLSNALLQIYYQLAVNAYREAGHEIVPDFTQPLDVQLCPLESTAITWQQYFLQQALGTWQSHVAMIQQSKAEALPLEEAYGRDEKKHSKYLKTEIYNLDLLYGYNTDYEVADAHQAYLDSLPTLLESLAAEKGSPSVAAFTNSLAGVGTNDTYLQEYAQLLNEGYMYMTSLSYYIEPTAEEVDAYFTQNEAAYAEKGITKNGSYINLRQILLVPEDATVAEDGTVTCSESSWTKCRKEAESLLREWNRDKTEAKFAELAYENSDDTGSKGNGGLYNNIAQGQLMEDLDLWCFDGSRQAGDTVIIRTALGYHILYLCPSSGIWYEQAEKDLIAHQLEQEIASARESYPMTVDYSAILLGEANTDMTLTADDLLYPDVAHERFPDAPLYFQQDYPNTKYGNYSLVTYGCGVTTMAMLVSYMADDEWTPPEMCALYGDYCSEAGTAHSMFTEVPTNHNFNCLKRVASWSEALEALEDGYMVVTLQRDGYWTNGGHYLLLHNLIETEDGTQIQVRDSNLYNYSRLKGHTSGSFELSTIPPNARSYWIYQKKVVNVDACVRCAEPTEQSHAPSAMFAEDYVCPKCQTAVNRRDAYIESCTLSSVPVQPEEAPTEEAVTEETTATETTPS